MPAIGDKPTQETSSGKAKKVSRRARPLPATSGKAKTTAGRRAPSCRAFSAIWGRTSSAARTATRPSRARGTRTKPTDPTKDAKALAARKSRTAARATATRNAPGGASDSDEAAGEGDVLARALEDLDGEIRDERIAATHRAGARPAGSDGEVERAGGGQGDESGESGNADGQGTSQSGGGAMPGRRTVASAMPPTPRPPLPSAPDTPDARDDDVVARQLREAAMAETDPELREALWEELERYKSGLSRRR